MVFGKQVTLIGDSTDRDSVNRLLRYVQVGDEFVNVELLKQGLGTATELQPFEACASTFKNAETIAMNAFVGLWQIKPTPTEP
jgi:endonuclease YncB( thermonuclease family)